MNILNKLGLLLAIPFVSACAPSSQNISTAPQEPVVVYSSVWGEQYGEAIVKNLGVDIPYIENQGFDLVETTDTYGDPLICIYVYEYEGHESEDLVEEYAAICADTGYAVTSGTQSSMDENYVVTQYTLFYADGWINDVDAIEIQFCEGQYQGKYALGIFAFNYVHYDTHAWPSKVVEKLLGHDVVGIDDSSFEYYAMMYKDDEGPYLYIQIEDAWGDTETEYKELLEQNGYSIDERYYDEGYGYYAYPINNEYKDHVIQFGYSYASGLEIYVIPYDVASALN